MRDWLWSLLVLSTIPAGIASALLLHELPRFLASGAANIVVHFLVAGFAIVLSAVLMFLFVAVVWTFFSFFGAVHELVKPR